MKIKIYFLSLALFLSVKLSVAQAVLNFFNVHQSSTTIIANWQSATETNLNHYSLERSIDSINYTTVINLAAAGNSTSPLNYSHTDASSFSNTCYYYRLKAIQFNGSIQYFNASKLCYNSSLGITNYINNNTTKIYPNPANNKITIDVTDVLDVKLFDVLGKQITSTKQNQMDVSNFNDGVYFIQVQTKQNTTTQKIIVQH
jgi:hypothetical protein